MYKLIIDQDLIQRLDDAQMNKLQQAHDNALAHVRANYHQVAHDREVARLHAIQLELDKAGRR